MLTSYTARQRLPGLPYRTGVHTMPIIHATFSTPLLATLAAVLASIVITATALLLIASAWDQWIHGEQ